MQRARLERSRRITRRGERGHETECRARAERVDGHNPPPPCNGHCEVSRPIGLSRERLEHLARHSCEATPFLLGPPLELVGVLDIKAIEERAVVQRRGFLQVSTRNVTLEFRHVAGNERVVQPELCRPTDDLCARDVALQLVKRLGEHVTRFFLVAVGPEAMHELRSAHPTRARDGELRQQRERTPTASRSLEWRSIALQPEPSQRSKPQHLRFGPG